MEKQASVEVMFWFICKTAERVLQGPIQQKELNIGFASTITLFTLKNYIVEF